MSQKHTTHPGPAIIPTRIVRVLVTLAERIQPTKTKWAITGSLSLALQGIDMVPNDIDILSDENGAYAIAKLFNEHLVTPVGFKRSPKYESHFGRLEIRGVGVEIMGSLRVFRSRQWSPVMTPETRKIVNVSVEGRTIPVVSLASQTDSGHLEKRLGKARSIG